MISIYFELLWTFPIVKNNYLQHYVNNFNPFITEAVII